MPILYYRSVETGLPVDANTPGFLQPPEGGPQQPPPRANQSARSARRWSLGWAAWFIVWRRRRARICECPRQNSSGRFVLLGWRPADGRKRNPRPWVAQPNWFAYWRWRKHW